MNLEEYIEADLRIDNHTDILARLSSFKRKANELGEYMNSKDWGIQRIHVNRSNENVPKISGTLPNELILEGLYRRFRFFILNSEDANYFRLLNLLSQNSKSDLLHQFCRIAKKEFYKEHSLEFALTTSEYKYKPEQVINFWFNSYYFHDEKVHHEKRKKFEAIVSAQGSKVVLWNTVRNSVRKIRYLNWLLRDTSEKNQKMYIKQLSKIC